MIEKRIELKNWSYILEEEEQFSRIGYKYMQSQNKDGLLRCTKLRYNGQLKFIYFVENYQNLPTILSSLQPDGVWPVFGKLLAAIVKIHNSGFLSCGNIEIAPEQIYFDPKTMEPHLIYLPLILNENAERERNFETNLRRSLIAALRLSNNVMVQERENMLLSVLDNREDGLEGMLKRLLEKSGEGAAVKGRGAGTASGAGKLCLICRNRKLGLNLEVNKERYLLGRSVKNDGVIDFSNKISRMHCSIVRQADGSYAVVDEQSSFGTWVNGTRCQQGRPILLRDGDELNLAGVISFIARIM